MIRPPSHRWVQRESGEPGGDVPCPPVDRFPGCAGMCFFEPGWNRAAVIRYVGRLVGEVPMLASNCSAPQTRPPDVGE